MTLNYETMDWEAEAKRVALAFGVEAPCRFRLKVKDGRERRDLLCGSHSHIVVNEALRLSAHYKPQTIYFKLHYEDIAAWATIAYNGEPAQFSNEPKYASLLIRGLYHLDLLSPFMEGFFCVSAHEKLEWMLERESRAQLGN